MSNPTLIDVAYRKALLAISSSTSAEQKIEILDRLVRYVRKISPVKCSDCGVEIDESTRDRCPKHVASAMAADFARNKAREHGPKIAMSAMSALNDLIEKHLGERDKPKKDPKDPDGPTPDLEFNP